MWGLIVAEYHGLFRSFKGYFCENLFDWTRGLLDYFVLNRHFIKIALFLKSFLCFPLLQFVIDAKIKSDEDLATMDDITLSSSSTAGSNLNSKLHLTARMDSVPSVKVNKNSDASVRDYECNISAQQQAFAKRT